MVARHTRDAAPASGDRSDRSPRCSTRNARTYNPLPRVPYDTRDVVQRHVDSTAHILYETNLYPVPEKHLGQLVYVCVGPDRLEVFDRGVHAIADHARIADGAGQTAASDRKRRGRYDVTLLQERFAAWGPSAEDFATKLRLRKRTPGPELDHILKLQVAWSVDDIVAAIEHATKYGAFDGRAVERILEARFRLAPARRADRRRHARPDPRRDEGPPRRATRPLDVRDAAARRRPPPRLARGGCP